MRPPLIWLFAGLALLGFQAPLRAQDAALLQAPLNSPPPLPSLLELEAAGAIVGAIHIANEDIFDLNDPQEGGALFGLANWLHIRTRPEVIERSLLFRSGELLSVRLLDETERLLRNNSYLYDVSITPVAYHDGVVDLEVKTRDTWTLDPGISISRQGGKNSSGISLEEKNLLGTGTSLSFSRKSNVDRTGNVFAIEQGHAFDGWTALKYSESRNSDGKRLEGSVTRPFFALDTRWAAGVSSLSDDRIDAIYNGGDIVGQYRHQEKRSEVFGGWSSGLNDGWVRRYTVGWLSEDHHFSVEPALPAPPEVPSDEKLVAPYLAYEVIEDNISKLTNRNQIARPEYFSLGFNSRFQLGRALTGLGSSRNLWLYEGQVSQGFEPAPSHLLVTSASLKGRYGSEGVTRQQLGGKATYYRPQSEHALFFASASVDILEHPLLSDLLQLGGDNGLRGYPLRYQTGENRVLFVLEQRGYSDLYLFRLFRVGGAIFYDLGRAWDDSAPGGPPSRWLSDAGFGLRILNARTAFGKVLHADIAFPINPDPGIKKVQFLLKSRASF